MEFLEDIGVINEGVCLCWQKSGGKPRKVMMEVMDYADPGPNTNTRSGYLTPPSSPPPPPSS